MYVQILKRSYVIKILCYKIKINKESIVKTICIQAQFESISKLLSICLQVIKGAIPLYLTVGPLASLLCCCEVLLIKVYSGLQSNRMFCSLNIATFAINLKNLIISIRIKNSLLQMKIASPTVFVCHSSSHHLLSFISFDNFNHFSSFVT